MRGLRLILIFLFSGFVSLSAQNSVKNFPTNDFRNPLGITNFLAGNFGELRNNHFHSGIDIKTNSKEGYEVFAAADGYITRINVSSRGYGNAIYISHPNGYTTVYAHLQKFNEKIEAYVRLYQYKNEKFEVEIHPGNREIPVRIGDLIAFSGNSGSSSGPHLHFEIRDTKTEEPLNPFLFGLVVPDSSRPLVNGIYVYPIDGNVNGKAGRQAISNGASVSASGKIGFGIKTYDKQNGAENLNGTYKISLSIDDKPYFTYTADRLNWDNMRGVNRLIDYKDRMENNSWVYQLFQPKGNPINMFSDVVNDGVLNVEEGKNYNIKITAEDFAGNKNTVSLRIIGKKPPENKNASSDNIIFEWDKNNHFKEDGLEITMPKGVLFDDIEFYFKKNENGKYTVHDWNVPVLSYYTISIDPSGIPADKLSKLVIKREYKQSGVWKSNFTAADYKNGKAVAKVRDFGVFSVVVDDTNPVITPVNIKENAKFTGNNAIIRFTIRDSQSGIKDFSARIDGKWILTNYDAKTNSLTINLSREGITNGKHQLELKVTDEKDNTATYSANFTKE